jgi:hypothetical protein
MPVNTQPNSGRFGQTYRVQPAPGGVYHVYPDGTKQFIKSGAAQPMADPNAGLAAAFAHAAQNTGTGPFAGNAAQWQAAAAATGTGGAAPAPVAPDDRDAAYWSGLAGLNKQRDDALAGNTSEGTANRQAYDEALRRLRADRPKDTAQVGVGANKQGLFYSSTAGNRLDDLATSYARREGDVQSGFDTQERARLAARTAIENGYPIDEAALHAEAAGRQITRDTSAADAGALAPPVAAAPAVAATVKPFREVRSGGVLYHVYPDGRRVPIRRVA